MILLGQIREHFATSRKLKIKILSKNVNDSYVIEIIYRGSYSDAGIGWQRGKKKVISAHALEKYWIPCGNT